MIYLASYPDFPPSPKKGEVELLNQFFEAGLMRFHLRKPKFSVEDLSKYLDQVSEKRHLPKIVVHREPELLEKFPVAGYHYRSTEEKEKSKVPSVVRYIN